MASLVESGQYVAINTTDTATNVFYGILFQSEAYTFQDNTIIYGQIITAGKLVVKSQYLCSMQVETNWYWIGINITNIIPSQCKHAQYFIYDLKLFQ